MPLDLKKVITQIKNLSTLEAENLNKTQLDSVYKLFSTVVKNEKTLLEKLLITQNSKKSSFFFAIPALNLDKSETLETTYDFPETFKATHIAIASDGSQINPSAHEVTSSFLINIGLVAIPYFSKNIPVTLLTEPKIYNSQEDIAVSSLSESIHEEDLVSYERTLREIEELVKLVKEYKQYNLPIVAFLDGTLIHWHIEKFSSLFIEEFIKRFSQTILELKALNIPVVSFLSNSRSNELINMLKIFNCPYKEVDCKKHCSNIATKQLPCNPCNDYIPVFDRRLIEKLFQKTNAKAGTRTILYKSISKILSYYPDELKVFFFYINTGTEVARVEIPAYVAKDNSLLELVHNAVAFQCNVGFGYPVTLSESHLQAVVNKSDRQTFYNLIKEQFARDKRTPVKLSTKELKKRISFV